MRRLLVLALSCVVASGLRAEGEDVIELDRWTTSVSAKLVLPQGGGDLRRLGGAAVRAGYYLTEFWCLETEGVWFEDKAGLAVDALWHWWGYERFDPFFTMGARGWLSDGDVGPMGGMGFFYHLTENLSLRFDADATLGLEREREVDFTFGAGIQYYW